MKLLLEALKLLSTLPEEAITIEPKPWYADEVKRRIEEYKSGNMEITPLHEGMEEIEEYLREINSIAS